MVDEVAEPMTPRPEVGEVWQDKDPRGGPTFRIAAVDSSDYGFALVEGLDGKRPRGIRLQRFGSYRRLAAAPTTLSGSEQIETSRETLADRTAAAARALWITKNLDNHPSMWAMLPEAVVAYWAGRAEVALVAAGLPSLLAQNEKLAAQLLARPAPTGSLEIT